MPAFNERASRSAAPPGSVVLPLSILGVIALIAAVIGMVQGAAHLAVSLAGRGRVPAFGRGTLDALRADGPAGLVGPRGPVGLFYAIAAAMVVLLLAIVTAVMALIVRSRHRRASAQGMAGGRQLNGITPKDARRNAQRLRPGAELRGVADYGLPLGIAVSDRIPLLLGWEDVALCVAGPRVGKTTSLCVPQILAAPGAVVATSNKPDLHDATSGVRAELGRVWVFDPQHVTRARPAAWWWNPLGAVTSIGAARKLVGHFVAATTDADAKRDAFFDPEGEALLAQYLLAAASAGGDLLHVHAWLSDEHDETAADLLDAGGHTSAGIGVRATQASAEKQRQGVFGTARKMVRVLEDDDYAALVTPPRRRRFRIERTTAGRPDVQFSDEAPAVGDPGRREFDAEAFVRSTDTMYLLSMEGPDSAAALTTALCAGIFDAGLAAAATQRAGRLTVPMLFMLDEAANVVRIRELPNLYSHFGSRGMVVVTVLQSYSQGEEVWGERGMRKLWSAANVRWYGGGVGDERFLRELSALIGDREVRSWTSSYAPSRGGGGGRSSSESRTREPILSVADLAALPRGRAVVLSSGNRPTLVKTVPWMVGPHAAAVRASLGQFEAPAAAAVRLNETARAAAEIAAADEQGVSVDEHGL